MATTTGVTAPSSTGSAPTFEQSQALAAQNLAQARQYFDAQMKMDREQQAISFASNVEAKGNQMLMACIQNIR